MTYPCACTTVRKASRSLFRFYEEAMVPSGLTITHFAILRTLDRNGPTPLSRLADELVMERTSLYRTIRPLADAGGVKIGPGTAGRAKIAELTKAGLRMMEAATPYWDNAQRIVIDQIGKDRWQDLSTALLEIPDLLSLTHPPTHPLGHRPHR